MQLNCDDCGAPGAYMVGNLDTGSQRVLCQAHYGAPVGAAAPAPPPATCEMCEANPPVAIQRALSDGSQMALCSACLLLSGRIAYLNAPDELRAAVDEMAGEGGSVPARGAARGRGRRRSIPLAEYDRQRHLEPDQAGVGDGVAVDQAGDADPLEPAPEERA